jgi:BlaI family penicillinase repressor
MARPSSRYPTELELEILKILWREGPCSGRQVRDALVPFRDLAYTSVMTILGIMTRKRYVRRNKHGPGYVYQASISEGQATKRMFRDMIDRLFDGSAVAVMQHLLETSDLDDEELRQLRQIINRKAKEQSP